MLSRATPVVRGALYALAAAVVILVVLLPVMRARILVEHSDSMAPALRVGDALLVRSLPASEVQLGDIVTLESAEVESTTHRVVERSEKKGRVRLVTRGDANNTTESWTLAAGDDAGVLTAHLPYIGFLLFWLSLDGVRASLLLAVGVFVVFGSPLRWLRPARRPGCAS